jgi:tetratricopeptide (TPR) repeat protein
VSDSDFAADLARIDRTIAELRDIAFRDPVDSEKATRYAHALYQRASLTGDLVALEAAEPVIDEAIRHLRLPGDLYFLKASLALKLHRLADARRCLETVPGLAGTAEAVALLADIDFQEGRYATARDTYLALITSDRSWDNLARLAHFEAKLGDTDAADRLYEEAADELTAKEMRSYAWIELQRGVLDLTRGRLGEARAHYERAARAYSGYWLVDEHIAELLGAEGDLAAAAALYEDVVRRAPKPELEQALGELYALIGDDARAERWFGKALDGYLAATRRGGLHYYHHLVDFYADVREDGAEALCWARRDIALRDNFATRGALAWALYRDGQIVEAAAETKTALSSGVKDARLFAEAADISRVAGDMAAAARYSELADALNPHRGAFHVHR